MQLKKTFAGLVVGAALTGGLVTAAATALPAVAGAQSVETATKPAEAGGRAGNWRALLTARRGEAATELAEFLGTTRRELRDDLQAGKSLAQIATEHGKTREELVAALNAAADARIDQAIANGKLTDERGAQAKTKAAERIERLVDRTRSAGTN